MGFLSSLFGTKSSTPSTTNVVQSKLPAELAPFVKEILGEAQQLYKGDLARGYQPYTGATIAPLTPDQEAALTGLAGLPGTTAPFLERATEIYETGGERFTPETAQEFMSPYQRAVTDIEKREAQRQFERTALPAFEKRAIDAGGMSGLGTRAGVEAAEMQRGQSQLLADIEARGLQKAYDDARKGFEQQKLRERGMAADLSGMGTQALTSGISELGAQKAAGEERQGLSQSVLDEAYYKFLEEQQFPQATLAQYQGSVYGNPLAKTFDKTETTTRPQPSTGQSLLSMGLSGLGMFGMGKGNIYGGGGGKSLFGAGGGSVGGLSDKKLGNYMREGSGAISAGDRDQLMRMYRSGLSGLPVVKRQNNAQVGRPEFIEDIIGIFNPGSLSQQTPDSLAYKKKVDEKRRQESAEALNRLKRGQETASSLRDRFSSYFSGKGSEDPETIKIKEDASQKIQEVEDAEEQAQRNLMTGPQTDFTEATDWFHGLSPADRVRARLGTQDPVEQVEVTKQADMLAAPPPKETLPPPAARKLDIDSLDIIQETTKDLKGSREATTKLRTDLAAMRKKDQETIEGSRNKRNELNFWRSLIAAGEAVGKADPAKGFLNALAEGATAGSKEYVDKRLALLKEAEGDGQKAINAIQTEIKIQQADSALIMSAGQVKAQQITAMANWIKNNGLKKMNTKVMAELIKNAKERAAVHPKDSQAARDAYSYTLRMSILAYEKTGGNLSTAIRAGLHVPVSQVNPTQNKLAATVGEESRIRKGKALGG
jgi:hypothetical protein